MFKIIACSICILVLGTAIYYYLKEKRRCRGEKNLYDYISNLFDCSTYHISIILVGPIRNRLFLYFYYI